MTRSEQARELHEQYPTMSQREIARRTQLSLYAVQCAIKASNTVGRPNGEPKTRLVFSLPSHLAAALRDYLAREKLTLAEFVTKSLSR